MCYMLPGLVVVISLSHMGSMHMCLVHMTMLFVSADAEENMQSHIIKQYFRIMIRNRLYDI